MKGTIEIRELNSLALKDNPLGDSSQRTNPIYLPPGYKTGKERYPVVYFLHGFTGSGLGWLNSSAFTLSTPERIDALIVSAKVPPFIGVFVDGWTALGGSQWINSPAIGNYRDYLVKDLVPWVDRELRTIPQSYARAVIGKSSGGYGAMVMGRWHSDIFGHIACHSGDACFEYCYVPDILKTVSVLNQAGGVDSWFSSFLKRAASTKMQSQDHAVINIIAMAAAYSPKMKSGLNLELPVDLKNGSLLQGVWQRWLEHDPVHFVPQNLKQFEKLDTIFIDCGSRDEYNLQWGARMLAEIFAKEKIKCTHEEFDDGHMGISYRYERSLLLILPRMCSSTQKS